LLYIRPAQRMPSFRARNSSLRA